MNLTTLATSAWKELLDSTKPQQWVFLNYAFLHWFGGKKMTIANEVVKAEVENAYELKRLEWKVTQQQIIQALQSADNEIEYQNLLWTMQKALPKINPENQEHEVDKDKMKRLKDLSKEFSSDDMQEVVAWILAWEYNQPWNFSLKTMDTVKSLSKDDIELFRKFCSMTFDWDTFFANQYNLWTSSHTVTNEQWVWYNQFLYLQEIWLIGNSTMSRIFWTEGDITTDFIYTFSIQWEILNLKKRGSFTLRWIGMLTIAGRELLPILEIYKNRQLLELVKGEFLKQWLTE